MISHFAISIEKPAIPRAPNIYAINANIRKNTARPIKPGMFHSSRLTDKSRDFLLLSRFFIESRLLINSKFVMFVNFDIYSHIICHNRMLLKYIQNCITKVYITKLI